MIIAILVFKIIMIVMSFLGYVIFINKKFNIAFEFTPMLLFVGIALVEYIAGLFNIMIIATLGILITGISLFIYYMRKLILSKDKKAIFKDINILNITVIVLLFTYFILISLRLHLLHYDNFSHWALVVQDMLSGNKLPNFESELITFKSYPVGSACFIYYICRVLNPSEQTMIIGQILLFLSGIITLFAFNNKKNKKYMSSLIITAFILFTAVFNMSFKELLVDNILTSIGIGSIAIIIYYYKDFKKMVILSMLLSLFLMLVKNSGIYFFAINTVIVLIRAKEAIKKNEYDRKDVLKYICMVIGVPILTMFLWKRHVVYAFGNLDYYGPHDMNAGSYALGMFKKGLDGIIQITTLFFSTVIDLENLSTQSILIINGLILIYILVMFILNKKWNTDLLKKLLLADGIYIAYLIGVLIMYLTSMPIDEANALAGYNRYILTIVLFLVGFLLIMIIKDIPKYNSKKEKLFIDLFIVVSVAIMCFGIYKTGYKPLLGQDNYQGSDKEKMDIICNEIKGDSDTKYMIFSNNDRGFIRFMSVYKLKSNNIKVLNNINIENTESKKDIKEYLQDCNYIIVLEKIENMEEVLENYGKDIPVIYKTTVN